MSGESTGARTRSRLAWAAGTASVAIGLGLRVLHRGPYVPGWDLLSAAQGLLRVSTEPTAAILRFYWDQGYVWSWTVWNLYAAPFVLVPGWLSAWWPWEYWAHVVTLATTALALLAVRAAARLPWGEGGVVLLAWGASATLLSWSVAGLCVMSAVLVHALALAAVLRLGRRWFASVLAWAGIHVLSWHAQDLAQTVFVVYLAAALLLPATRTTRLVWAAGGLVQLATTLLHPTQLRFRFVPWHGVPEAAASLWGLLGHLFAGPGIDLPFTLLLGVACAFSLRDGRWFWRVVIGTQMVLVGALALHSVEAVWPRRCVLLLGYLSIATVARYRELGERGRGILLGLLLLANGWQVAASVAWARAPLPWTVVPEVVVPLPYTETTLDYRVVVPAVDWYHQLLAAVAAGRKLLLIYNHASFLENTADPAGVLERLYLVLGDAGFRDAVVAFGGNTRWIAPTFPLRPLGAIDEVMARVAARPDDWVVYAVRHDADAPEFAAESAAVRTALASRFDLEPEPVVTVPAFGNFTIERLWLRRPVTDSMAEPRNVDVKEATR